jgi:tetratricopeptide (TPR) repeat protein
MPAGLVSAYALRAYNVSERGVQSAGSGDWAAAAASFDEATRDDPYFAFYCFEAGYAYGILASRGDQDSLDVAIARYERGLQLEPNYSLNYANLGALYLQAGRAAEAQAAMQRAISLSGPPGWWLYHLNYGVISERMGETAAAGDAYLDALNARGSIAEAQFWQASGLRRTVLRNWLNAQDGTPITDRVLNGFALLEAADVALAQEEFEGAWRADPINPTVYEGLARTALASHDIDLAAAYLAAAISLQTASNEAKVSPLLTWAELSAMQGESAQARSHYESAFSAVSDATIHGWGTNGFNPYAWFVFGRNTMPVDLLPQLTRADVSPEMARRLLPLGLMLEEDGDLPSAEALYVRLLEFDSGLAAARQRLVALRDR